MTTGSSSHRIHGHPFQGRVWRDLAQLAAEALAAGLVVSLALALAIFIAAAQAKPDEPYDATTADAGAPSAVPLAAPER
ncbi:MAG: hypothetical protein ABI886_17215 [Betaproteobacteria bacterium]